MAATETVRTSFFDAYMSIHQAAAQEVDGIGYGYVGTALGFIATLREAGGFMSPPIGNALAEYGLSTPTNPDDKYGGRSHIEQKWGTWFLNVGALTRWHVKRTVVPMSRLTLVDGSDEVRVQCYLHTNQYAPIGWYQPAERRFKLSKPFKFC